MLHKRYSFRLDFNTPTHVPRKCIRHSDDSLGRSMVGLVGVSVFLFYLTLFCFHWSESRGFPWEVYRVVAVVTLEGTDSVLGHLFLSLFVLIKLRRQLLVNGYIFGGGSQRKGFLESFFFFLIPSDGRRTNNHPEFYVLYLRTRQCVRMCVCVTLYLAIELRL